MLIYDINYENYKLLGKNIIACQNDRILLKVSVFMSLLKQYHTMIWYTNIQELPNEQQGKKTEKEATELGIPCVIPPTYAFFW